MNPITPHLSEEVSHELVSSSTWPEVSQEKISLSAEAGENLISSTMEGMRNVLKLSKLEKANKFTLFIAEDWLYELFSVISREIKVTHNPGEIMKKVLEIAVRMCISCLKNAGRESLRYILQLEVILNMMLNLYKQ